MRKKIIILNSFIILLSLISMLLISSLIIYKKNYDTYCKQIKDYLNLTAKIFDGENFNETIDKMNVNDIRITIIDNVGAVVIDSEKDYLDNHKDRPELQIDNLGKVYKRYSNTEKKEMLYIAGLDDGYFIRLSIPMGDINQTIITFVYIGILALIIIFVVSLSIFILLSNKSMKKIMVKVNELSKLAKTDVSSTDLTIEELTTILDSLTNLLNTRINEIEVQMEKLKTVLDLLNQAVIVISNDGLIKLINNKGKELLHTNDSIINNKFIFLFLDIELQEILLTAIREKNHIEKTKIMDNKALYFAFNHVNNSWLEDGIIITIEDITEDYNLDKTKKDFFQNASHELKSPLTSIIGYEQLIVEGIVTDDEAIEYSKKVLSEARRMNNIIIDMLDLASLEQNYLVKQEEVNMKIIITNILCSLDNMINAKNINVNLDVDDEIVMGDSRLIDEMVRNLIDNAIKYNKDNGELTVEFKNKTLKVKDTGIGIAKENLNRIFERFYCENKGRNKANNGTGLGLAIVKHICEISDYEIKVESFVNIGSTFMVKMK